jgi:folate-binding protein YgfZ
LKQDSSSGYTALRQGAASVDPAWTGRIQLKGVDRRSYLQGLLTNDIEALGHWTGCYAAMLNAQGRMLTDMRVLELGDSVLLIVPAFITAAIRDHLDRFVFAEDVQVEDATDSRAAVAVYGPQAADVLQHAGLHGEPPSSTYGSAPLRVGDIDVIVVRDDEPGIGGYTLIVAAAAATRLREALSRAGATPATDHDVETVRIEQGRPRFGADMDTDTIPLEAGIEDRAISRTKGCYVGQEVIVRVLDRGHGRVARRLVGLTFGAGPVVQVPVAGTPITSGDREIGRITSATWSPLRGQPIALGYVHRDFVEPATVVEVAGENAAVADLPFVRHG